MLRNTLLGAMPRIMFDADEGAGGATPAVEPGATPTDGPTVADLQAQIAEQDRRINTLNSESAGRRRELEGYKKDEEERKKAELTELEKATGKVSEAEAERDRAIAERDGMLISNAVMAEAAKQGVPQDRLLAAMKLVNRSTLVLEGDGSILGVQEAVAGLLAANSFLKAAPPIAPDLEGGAGGGTTPETQVRLTAEQKTIAKLSGMTEQEYSESLRAREGLYLAPIKPKDKEKLDG